MKRKVVSLGIAICMLLASTLQAQTMMNTKHYNSHFEYQSSLSFNGGVGQFHFDGRTLQNKNPNFCFDQVIAYQFNPHVDLGVDLGVNVWGKKTAFIPVGVHLGVDCLDKKITPHFYLNGGYAFKWYVSAKPEKMSRVIYGAKSGPYANAGIGAKLRLKDQLRLVFAVDYKMQYSTLQYWHQDDPLAYDYSMVTTNKTVNKFYHFVGVKIGLLYW